MRLVQATMLLMEELAVALCGKGVGVETVECEEHRAEVEVGWKRTPSSI